MDDKISLIIPAYNCERYIRRALDSALEQTYRNAEIILVNDGSTDGTGKICADYAEKYEQIRYFFQGNGGVSAARRYGAAQASGTYFAFLDADDWIDADFLERLAGELGDGDVIAAGCEKVLETGEAVCEYNGCSAGTYTGEAARKELYSRMLCKEEPFVFGVLPYLCTKIFKRELVNGWIREIDTRINDGEDVGIVIPTLLGAEKIILSDYCGYHYQMHEAQACARKKEDAYLNASCLYTWLYEKTQALGHGAALKPQIDQYMRFMVWKYDNAAMSGLNRFYFPFKKVKAGSSVVLYGGGNVGRTYYWQIKGTAYCRILAWADKKHEDVYDEVMQVQKIPPEKVPAYEADCVVIALNDLLVIEKVIACLRELGVDGKKIVYADPV